MRWSLSYAESLEPLPTDATRSFPMGNPADEKAIYRHSLKQQSQPGRIVGLTKEGYRGAPLLRTIGAPQMIRVPGKKAQNSMPPKVALRKHKEAQVKKEAEDNFDAPPKGSSDDDSSENEILSANIRSSVFKRTSEEPAKQPSGCRSALTGRTINNTTTSTKIASQGSSGSKRSPSSRIGSPKRKSQDDLSTLGAGIKTNVFGDIIPQTKRAKKSSSQTYGSKPSSQKAKPSSQQSKKKQGIIVADSDDEDAKDARKGFIKPVVDYAAKDSDEEDCRPFRKIDPVPELSPASPRSPKKSFIAPEKYNSPAKKDDEKLSGFKNPLVTGSMNLEPEKTAPVEEPPASQYASFQIPERLGLQEDDLAVFIDVLKDIPQLSGPDISATYEDYDLTSTQLARCPMCNAPVDPDELRAQGYMNTRKQEKFCRSHQKKTAVDEWEENYPEIEWEKLDSRIAEHHAFIKELVKGKDCHYRQELDEKVKAGKERNLLKMTSNLTPGYYGSRGLREISECIMKDFTPLLKKCVVTDRLMASRGVTGFVQSVLVPEVTVRLIMEDLTIKDVAKAREILTESAAIGELVHEEIRDVVTRLVEDSEDDDF